jgi:hypothetical protein
MTMILFAMVILVHEKSGKNTRIQPMEWGGLILGSLVLIIGFIFDYTQHMLVHFSPGEMLQIKNPEVLEVATRYMPVQFPWWIFGTGELIILGSIGLYWRRLKKMLP